MKSIRAQIQKKIFFVLLIQFILFFVSLLIARFYQIYKTQKNELEHISIQIKEIITNNEGTYKTNHQADDMFASINEKLNFAFQKDHLQIAYQINLDGEIVYSHLPHTDLFDNPTDFKKQNESHSFFTKPVSFSNWLYFCYQREEPFDIWVYSHHRFVILDFALIWAAIFFPLVLLLSFFISKSISKKITTPIESIFQTSENIVKGSLNARIPEKYEEIELHRLIKTLNQTFNELEKSFNKITQFSADAAHEINTPLTIMRGQIEVCLKQVRSIEDYQSTLHNCIEEISKLTKIIDILLLTSKPNTYLKNNFKTIDLSNLLLETTNQFKILSDDKNIHLHTDIQAQQTIIGHEILIKQVFYNLLSNALKFTPANKSISVQLKSNNESIDIVFQDEGIGIEEKDLPNIFQKFYQANKSNHSGAGLGLSLVKWVVDQHNAAITCQSTPNKNTTFKITFKKEVETSS